MDMPFSGPQEAESSSIAVSSSTNAIQQSGSIGRPVAFTSGPLGGFTLRAELSELQAAQLGRKSGAKDRRALDPPPVVVIRLYQTTRNDNNEHIETEIADYSMIYAQGLVCYFDLFMIHSTDVPLPILPISSDGQPPDIASGWEHRITEMDRCTEQLAGTTFVPAHNVPYMNGHALMFVFADTSVRTEGVFVPRYRCFDVFSTVSGANERPILAECLGIPFRVYSTKTCPTLPPSTNLTKLLSRNGIRVNVRESTRTVRSRKGKNGPKALETVDGDDEGNQEDEE